MPVGKWCYVNEWSRSGNKKLAAIPRRELSA